MRWLHVILIVACLTAAAVAHKATPKEVLTPIEYTSALEKKCLMRYATPRSRMDNRECFNRCMTEDETDGDCVELTPAAFSADVEFPCHTHYVPYFEDRPPAKMRPGRDIVRTFARSAPECQMFCQEEKKCTMYLYYSPQHPDNPSNCDLLLDFASPTRPSMLEDGRVNNVDGYRRVVAEHQCIVCDGVEESKRDSTCGRFHPYIVGGKRHCSKVHSLFHVPISTKSSSKCRVRTPKDAFYQGAYWPLSDQIGVPDMIDDAIAKAPTTTMRPTTKGLEEGEEEATEVAETTRTKKVVVHDEDDDEDDDGEKKPHKCRGRRCCRRPCRRLGCSRSCGPRVRIEIN